MMKRSVIVLMLILFLFGAAAVSAQDGPAVYVDGVPILQSQVLKRAGFAGASGDEISEDIWKKTLLTMITEQVCLNEAVRLGLDGTEETAAETDIRYKKMIDAVETYVRGSYPNLLQSEMDEQVDSLLKALGESRDSYRETAGRSAMISALENYWMQHYPLPSEEGILEYYNKLYKAQKDLFDSDENAFESAMLNHELVLYRPVDLKLIRKAEFLFSSDVISFLRRARSLGVSSYDSQVEAQYHALADEVEPVYEALLNGETTFDDVLEYLEPGSSLKVNYFHSSSTRFSPEYYERADAFTRVGEISTAYLIPNGYAVLEYYGDLPSGDLPLEEAAGSIQERIIKESSKDYLSGKKQELLDSAEILFVTDEK